MSTKILKKKILITGGGSGGHVSPVQGIIDKFKEKYGNAQEKILYVGGKLVSESDSSGKSVEEMRFENSQTKFISIRSGKLQRVFSLKSIKLLFGIIGGFIDAWKVIEKFKPDIIFSTGGYVTVPVCLVGWLKKIPIYLHEQTAAVGLTNKIVSKFAKKIYISFKQSAKFFPKGKTLHTGNIIRKCVFEKKGSGPVARAVKTMQPKRDKFPIICIVGGGLGSHFLNLITRQMLPYLLTEFQVILQTGKDSSHKDYDIMQKERDKLPKDKQSMFFPTKFIDENEFGYVFRNIDIYVGRAGANFVYEMGLLRKPSVLIPIPWVTHNEQTLNAQTLVEAGLGRIIPQGEVTAEKLFNELQKFKDICIRGGYCGDNEALDRLFPVNAAEKIIDDLNLGD
ncbi:hypothetical protein GF357_00745 [Candidatus Dojkabacteria bacterium]|nr:hypothetical protein [Candidatus Dojkabacteria bacterium]